jgi:bifunctional DNase/RNase
MMPTLVPAGMLALPLVLLVGSVGLVANAGRERKDPAPERVQLEVAGVLPMSEGSTAILVLREKGAEVLLPLILADGQAFASGPGERSGKEALLPQAIQALGGRVFEVEIDEAQETSSSARVVVGQGSRRVELHALPSESVALAVATGVPIVTSRRVMDEAGLTPEDLARAHAREQRGAPALRL